MRRTLGAIGAWRRSPIDLPEDQQRLLLVIEEVGMRGSELCEALFDCLLQDDEGDYFEDVPETVELQAILG